MQAIVIVALSVVIAFSMPTSARASSAAGTRRAAATRLALDLHPMRRRLFTLSEQWRWLLCSAHAGLRSFTLLRTAAR